VEYAVADTFQYAMNCHCSNCRRATGSAFKPFAGIERDRLRITRGSDGVTIFGSETGPHDVHCATCGSLLYSVVREAAYVHVTLGTLIDEPTIPLRCTSTSDQRRNGIRSPTIYPNSRHSPTI
jgi:hypothetical protein